MGYVVAYPERKDHNGVRDVSSKAQPRRSYKREMIMTWEQDAALVVLA
jgi:hypothetical protein